MKSLQWGHDFDVVEDVADREPFLTSWSSRWVQVGFNGATTLTSWKTPTRPQISTRRPEEPGCQWGHDFDVVEDGRRGPSYGRHRDRQRLQWGHDFDVVEDTELAPPDPKPR